MTAAAGSPPPGATSDPETGSASVTGSVTGSVPGSGAKAAHEHAWALMQFELVDGHPVVRQHCETCGFVRRYRAWERYWSPPSTARSGR